MHSTITPVTRKIPAMPLPMMGSVCKNASKFILFPSHQKIQQQTARNDGRDLPGYVDAHALHEQIILRVLFDRHL